MKYVKSKVRQLIEQELQEFFGKRREREWEKIASEPTHRMTDRGIGANFDSDDPAAPQEVSGGANRSIYDVVSRVLQGGHAEQDTFYSDPGPVMRNVEKIIAREASGRLEEQSLTSPLGGVPPRADSGPVAARRDATRPAPEGSKTVVLKAEEVFEGWDAAPPGEHPKILAALVKALNNEFTGAVQFAAEEQAAPAETEATPAGDPIVALTMKWLKDIQSGKADRFMSTAVDINDSGAADEFVKLLLADIAKRGGLEEEDAGKGVPEEMVNRLLSAAQERFKSLGADSGEFEPLPGWGDEAAPAAAAAEKPIRLTPDMRTTMGAETEAGTEAEDFIKKQFAKKVPLAAIRDFVQGSNIDGPTGREIVKLMKDRGYTLSESQLREMLGRFLLKEGENKKTLNRWKEIAGIK